MLKRGVPRPLALAYLREACRASIGGALIRAGIGLRQGCSATPMLFRWVLQRFMEALHTRWEASGLGIHLFGKGLHSSSLGRR